MSWVNGPAASGVRRVVLLGLAAGYIECVGFTQLAGIFPGIMTGNTVQFGMAMAQNHWARALVVGLALLFFFVGALLASVLRQNLKRPAFGLVVMAGLLLGATVVRSVWGVDTHAELALLAFAMALQGQTVSKFGGVSVQTVVATNNLLKFADGLVGRYLRRLRPTGAPGPARPSFTDVVLPGSAWFGYVIGAAFGAFAVAGMMFPLVVPMLLLVGVAVDLLRWPDAGA